MHREASEISCHLACRRLGDGRFSVDGELRLDEALFDCGTPRTT